MENQKEIILSLDTASRKTGYAIYKNGKITNHGFWGIDQLRPYADLEKRILKAISQYKVTAIVAEDIYKDKDLRKQSAFDVLSKCQGVLRLISEREEIPLNLLDGRIAKREMWGYTTARPDHKFMVREEQKKRMVNRVQFLGYQLHTEKNGKINDDEADAIGILITHCKLKNIPISYPKPN